MTMFGGKNPEVLVVGAGPVGLFAALSLARLGVRVEIVDRQWRTRAHSYALALHGQSLQMLGELGLAESIVERAYRVNSVGLYDASDRRAEMRISELGGPFPFVAVMPPDQLERVLERALEQCGVKVRWNHEVARLVTRTNRGVSATIHRLQKQSTGYAIAHTEWVVADTAQLEVVAEVHNPPQRSLPEQVLSLLAEGVVLTRAKLRDALAVKNERLGEALESLERAGRLRRTQGGWQRLD
ncbi:MAG: FAD-dependent monooxygenase [Pirellulales bacterium]|nr:FAD-dependent monooxygenase [Pirellulales bacterium]